MERGGRHHFITMREGNHFAHGDGWALWTKARGGAEAILAQWGGGEPFWHNGGGEPFWHKKGCSLFDLGPLNRVTLIYSVPFLNS